MAVWAFYIPDKERSIVAAVTAGLAVCAATILASPAAAPAVLGVASGISAAALAEQAGGGELHVAATAAALLAAGHLAVVVAVGG